MSSTAKVNERYDGELKTHGKFSLSIGTSLAIETLFGVNDNVKPTFPLPYSHYRYLFVNIRTLIRNMNGAVLKELKTTWSFQNYLDEIQKELQFLPEIVHDYSKGEMEVVFYADSYRDLRKKFPNAILKQTKGPVALAYEELEDKLVGVLTQASYLERFGIIRTNCLVPLPKYKTLMLTHVPLDLIPYAQTNRCDLLESHTGVIKDKTLWYTKLAARDLERIPFTRFTIQVFGDGKNFSGLPAKYKRALQEHAAASWWNQSTTDKLMKLSIKNIGDKEIVSVLRELF